MKKIILFSEMNTKDFENFVFMEKKLCEIVEIFETNELNFFFAFHTNQFIYIKNSIIFFWESIYLHKK